MWHYNAYTQSWMAHQHIVTYVYEHGVLSQYRVHIGLMIDGDNARPLADSGLRMCIPATLHASCLLVLIVDGCHLLSVCLVAMYPIYYVFVDGGERHLSWPPRRIDARTGRTRLFIT